MVHIYDEAVKYSLLAPVSTLRNATPNQLLDFKLFSRNWWSSHFSTTLWSTYLVHIFLALLQGWKTVSCFVRRYMTSLPPSPPQSQLSSKGTQVGKVRSLATEGRASTWNAVKWERSQVTQNRSTDSLLFAFTLHHDCGHLLCAALLQFFLMQFFYLAHSGHSGSLRSLRTSYFEWNIQLFGTLVRSKPGLIFNNLVRWVFKNEWPYHI